MTKVAFMFPGQGSQEVGMGAAFAAASPAARAVYDEASEAPGSTSPRSASTGRSSGCRPRR
jgi:[acyl-carrier-protein] S-malonyltransferase